MNNYDNASSCGKTSNWLTPSSGYYWTISPRASISSYAWYVESGGYAIGNGNVYYQRGARPDEASYIIPINRPDSCQKGLLQNLL